MRISDWSSDVCSSDLIAAKTKPPFSLETGGGGLRDPLDRAPALTLRDQPERVLERLAGAGVVIPVERHVGAPAVGRDRLGLTGRHLQRSEERRVGKGCVSPGRSRWAPDR